MTNETLTPEQAQEILANAQKGLVEEYQSFTDAMLKDIDAEANELRNARTEENLLESLEIDN